MRFANPRQFDELIETARCAVVAEAQSWLGTPYHHMGRVKGVGCDCLTLLAEVFERADVVDHIRIPYYPPDWHLHRSTEHYLEAVQRYASEVSVPQPGDIVLFRFGRCFSHGAIVTNWPALIHAWHVGGVLRANAGQSLLAKRAVRFFDPFAAHGDASERKAGPSRTCSESGGRRRSVV